MVYTTWFRPLVVSEDRDVRDTFPEFYYNPSIKKLWKKAIFVPDTNVLLDIYCYPPETSRALVKILSHLKDQDRLWIPYQFAQEYLKNLPYVRQNIREDFKRNKKALDTLSTDILNFLTGFNEVTDFNLDKSIGEIKVTFKTIKKGLQEFREKHEARLENDNLENVVEELLVGIIGCQFPPEQLVKAYDDGALRFRLRQPPGFKDAGKDESRRYGDLIGWLQIISYVQGLERKHPIIMITSDSSGHDWFYKPALDGKTRGPRPELVGEMRAKADVDFYIHETWEFIELANEYLDLDAPIPETTIKEAKRPRKPSVMYDPVSGISKTAGLSLHMDRNNQIQQTLKDLYGPVDLSEQLQQTLKDLYEPVDLSKQMQQTLKDLYGPVDLSKQMQQTLKDLYGPVDLSEQLQQTLKDLHAPVDLSKQMQQTLKDLYGPVDLSKQMRQTLKDLQAPVDLSKQIQQTVKDLQQQTDVNALIRRARPSLADVARNAREAGLSSKKPVDTAERSREILTNRNEESTPSDDE